MSFFYKANNNNSARELYLKNSIYNIEITEPEYENLINFYHTERYLYGRVNYSYVPIAFDPILAPLKNLGTTNTEQSDFVAAAFVVDAFNDLNQKFNTKALTGDISPNDKFLSKLEVKKAYQDPRRLYAEHIAAVKSSIVDYITDENLKFADFKEFLPIFETIITKVSKGMPCTYSGFLKSRYCPMNVSGLVIEIADSAYSNDAAKIKNFKQSPNWLFYLNACRSYGFWVDASNPFRLIANIGSSEMVEYARAATECKFTSTLGILMGNYTPAYLGYMQTYMQLMIDVYNASKQDYIEVEHCDSGRILNKVITPPTYTSEEIPFLLSEARFLQIYTKLRVNEANVKYEEFEMNNLVRQINTYFRIDGLDSALSILERGINVMYDYNGSLTDIVHRVKLMKQEEINVLSNT